jgi:uncharacterized membrane protein YbhN (UPF0104 family)
LSSIPSSNTASNITKDDQPKKGVPGWVKLLLKLVVSGGCLWYVGQKIDWADTWRLLKTSNVFWLVFATVFFVLSKVVSSFRLNLYFRNIAVRLSEMVNLKLNWLSLFYNLFLPGGIGGDAYKVILLNKRYPETGARKLTAAVFLDRVSGVAGLGILAAVFYFIVFQPAWHAWALVLSIVPGMFIFLFVVKKWFPSFVSSFFPTLWYGLAVQLLQVICVYGIMQSIGIHHHFAEFQLLFLVSSIVSILPFTIGGLGAREIVFLWGSQQFNLVQSEAIFISLLFYLITLVSSLVGIYWVYKSPFDDNEK